MARPIRLAIVGCGKMGLIHREAALQLIRGRREHYYKGGVESCLKRLVLDALADPRFRARGRDAHGCHRFRSHAELLRKRPIDLAIIATPSTTHEEIARDFLARGIPLLIEKPVACSTAEIHSIQEMARAHKAFVLPGHVERYNPVTLDILEILKFRLYGRVRSYQFTRTSRRPGRISDSIIIDKLIHDLDLLHLFFGRPQVEQALFKRDRHGTVIETDLVFRHRNGVTGRVFSSWRVPKKERSILIRAARGEVRADFTEKTLFVNRFHELGKAISGYMNNQVKDQMADFIAGAYGLFPPLVTLEDALRSGRLIDRIAKIAEETARTQD